MLNIYCLYFFTYHQPSGDRRVIGDRCGDRLLSTYHHALNPDEQGCSWLPVIGDRGKCEKLLCISVLPASFFFSLRTHIRTHEYNNVSFPSSLFPRPVHSLKKMSRHFVMFQRFIFSFPKNFKKIVEYIWSVSEKRVLLHPLSRRGEPCGIDMMTKRRTA